jgi:hypothetical protein
VYHVRYVFVCALQAVQSLYGPLQRISYVNPESVLEVVLPVSGSQNRLVQVVAQAACSGIAATALFAQVDSDSVYASNSTQQVYTFIRRLSLTVDHWWKLDC